ncbi:MAG: O-antigen ligase family protein [Candidatus Omnitrophota bacterium]
MSKISSERIVLFFMILFIIWISFVPDPIKFQYNNVFNIILWILFLVSFFKKRHDFKEYFLDNGKFFWVYLFLFSINIYFSQNKLSSYVYYRDFVLSAIPIYYLARNEINSKNVKSVLYVLCICAGLVAFFGFLEMLFERNIIYERYISNYFYHRYLIEEKRMMSTLAHPNILGSYLITCLPLAYYFYKSEKRKTLKNFNFTVFLVIFSAMVFTFSRGTYLAGFLTFLILLILKKRFKTVIFVLCLGILFIIFCSLRLYVISEFTHRFSIQRLWSYLSTGHRTGAYLVTWNMLRHHPFVGIGLNNFRLVFNEYSSLRLPHELMIPDSVYLMHLAETGVIGSVGFIIFLESIIKRSFLCYKKSEGYRKEMFSVVLIGFTAMLFNVNTFDAFLWKTSFYLFWLVIGLIISFDREISSSER